MRDSNFTTETKRDGEPPRSAPDHAMSTARPRRNWLLALALTTGTLALGACDVDSTSGSAGPEVAFKDPNGGWESTDSEGSTTGETGGPTTGAPTAGEPTATESNGTSPGESESEGEGGGGGEGGDEGEGDPGGSLCAQTGGVESTGLCCGSVGDFPDTCLIGACGCAPDNSHEVRTCICPEGQCFNSAIGCIADG